MNLGDVQLRTSGSTVIAKLTGEIDLAVHSLKDVPSDEEEPLLKLAAYSPREDPRDVLGKA